MNARTVLSHRALNRALLARQHLLRRAAMPAIGMIEHLVGLQAQAVNPPYIGLWSRIEGFRHEELAGLLRARAAVRTWLMRSTLHLCSAGDALALRPVLQASIARGMTGGGRKAALDGMDTPALVKYGRRLLERGVYSNAELAPVLAAKWPGRDGNVLAQALHSQLALVHVPPRGLWGASGPAACTTLQAWLGKPLGRAVRAETLVLRYLAAFGPASVADVQAWSGMTRLAAVFERLRGQLATFVNEDGVALFDLPDAPRPSPDTPAPVRFIAEYDNLVLGHADRRRVIDDAYKPRMMSRNGIVPGTFLVDGMVAGSWRATAHGVEIEPFRALDVREQEAVQAEAAQLQAFISA